jgi:chemotaxis methyl-accepting protein methylase
MAFDPLSGTSGLGDLPSDETAAIVRRAAERLLDDLSHAESASDSWQNEKLAQPLVDHALSQCLNRLTLTGLWGEANQFLSSVFWKTAGPVLEVGWLQQRARTKPLGYAGDHEILARMSENSSCDHPLGRLFDRYFLALAAPQAVRARCEHVASTLVARYLNHVGTRYRVVSVGSGPGIDIQTALSALPQGEREHVEVTLLDLDPEALEHASRRILQFVPQKNLICRRENLFRLASNGSLAAELNGTDLIICTGFFDYLRDDVAAEMLQFFWQCLAPGGQMLVGNFAPHNPTRAYMEWIGNWYLTYRTADELRDLAARADIPARKFSIQTERTGADLFLVGEKT